MKDTIKTLAKHFMLMVLVWYGMGSPIPTSFVEGIKLVFAILCSVYLGYKNFNYTEQARLAQQYLNIFKADGGLTAFEELLQEFDDVDEEE